MASETIHEAVTTTWQGQRVQVQKVPGDPSATPPVKDRISVQFFSGGAGQFFDVDQVPEDLQEALNNGRPVVEPS